MTENVEKEILEEVMEWLNEEIAPLSKKATMNNTEMAYRRVRARIDKGFADRGLKELPDTYENSRARELAIKNQGDRNTSVGMSAAYAVELANKDKEFPGNPT
jgi:hypothetical protein